MMKYVYAFCFVVIAVTFAVMTWQVSSTVQMLQLYAEMGSLYGLQY